MSLCLSCGLCCDGTLFPGGPATPGEADRFAGVLQFSEDKKRLTLPCRALDGCRCAIYSQERPRVCGEFKCLLLASLEEGTITEAEAREGVDELMRRRAAVAALLGIEDPRRGLQLAREQAAAGTASPELLEALHRLRRLALLMTLPPGARSPLPRDESA